jgi:hypothetical protein
MDHPGKLGNEKTDHFRLQNNFIYCTIWTIESSEAWTDVAYRNYLYHLQRCQDRQDHDHGLLRLSYCCTYRNKPVWRECVGC